MFHKLWEIAWRKNEEDGQEKEDMHKMFDLQNINEFAEVLYGFDLVTTDYREEVRSNEISKSESIFKKNKRIGTESEGISFTAEKEKLDGFVSVENTIIESFSLARREVSTLLKKKTTCENIIS